MSSEQSDQTPTAGGHAASVLAELATEMRANSERWFPSWHSPELGMPLTVAYALGLAGEVGKVANVVKKMQRDGIDAYAKSGGEGLGAELADCLTYLLLLADEAKVDLVSEYRRKVEKNEDRWWRVERRASELVPGDRVIGSGVLAHTSEGGNGRLYLHFERGVEDGGIPTTAPGWRLGCNEWTRGVAPWDLLRVHPAASRPEVDRG